VLWAIGTLRYFVEWEDAPGVPVFVLGQKSEKLPRFVP
jgi:hypothetical protein